MPTRPPAKLAASEAFQKRRQTHAMANPSLAPASLSTSNPERTQSAAAVFATMAAVQFATVTPRGDGFPMRSERNINAFARRRRPAAEQVGSKRTANNRRRTPEMRAVQRVVRNEGVTLRKAKKSPQFLKKILLTVRTTGLY